MPALRKQRKADLCKFEDSTRSTIASSRTGSKATENPCLEKRIKNTVYNQIWNEPFVKYYNPVVFIKGEKQSFLDLTHSTHFTPTQHHFVYILRVHKVKLLVSINSGTLTLTSLTLLE